MVPPFLRAPWLISFAAAFVPFLSVCVVWRPPLLPPIVSSCFLVLCLRVPRLPDSLRSWLRNSGFLSPMFVNLDIMFPRFPVSLVSCYLISWCRVSGFPGSCSRFRSVLIWSGTIRSDLILSWSVPIVIGSVPGADPDLIWSGPDLFLICSGPVRSDLVCLSGPVLYCPGTVRSVLVRPVLSCTYVLSVLFCLYCLVLYWSWYLSCPGPGTVWSIQSPRQDGRSVHKYVDSFTYFTNVLCNVCTI